jgi:hypothetical protein
MNGGDQFKFHESTKDESENCACHHMGVNDVRRKRGDHGTQSVDGLDQLSRGATLVDDNMLNPVRREKRIKLSAAADDSDRMTFPRLHTRQVNRYMHMTVKMPRMVQEMDDPHNDLIFKTALTEFRILDRVPWKKEAWPTPF